MKPNLPVIILGGGGHAKVLIDTLHQRGFKLLGLTTASPFSDDLQIMGIPVIGDDEAVRKYNPQEVSLVNGLGSVKTTLKRSSLYLKFKEWGYMFASVIHPSVIIAPDVKIAEGVHLMAGVIIQPGSSIGANAILNTGSSVDHDCDISAHVHIAPGATLSGAVKVGNGSHIGTGAIVIQGIWIGKNCLVGAGAVVTEHVSDGWTVAGVPAKRYQ